MARLRRDTLSTSSTTHSPTSTYVNPPMPSPSISKPFRIFSTGTIFLTYSLDLCSHPVRVTASRAQAVTIARGGSAGHILGFLAALPAAVEPMLIANRWSAHQNTVKPWPGLGVPSAWVMHARDTGERTVINHNPLPEVSHEDFICLAGPLTAPHMAIVPTQSSLSPAPFDWMHFEGRSIKTTLSNILGVDGLARERNVDLGRRAREGVEALISHADVIFLSAQTFPSLSNPQLNAVTLAHLLRALSSLRSHDTHLHTRSLSHAHTNSNLHSIMSTAEGVRERAQRVRILGWPPQPDSSGFTMGDNPSPARNRDSGYSEDHDDEPRRRTSSAGESFHPLDDDDDEDDARSTHTTRGTSLPHSLPNPHLRTNGHGHDHAHARPPQHVQSSIPVQPPPPPSEDLQDEEGAHSAFIAGMIWSLSRRTLPGAPYTPVQAEEKESDVTARWRLDECLRFATECAGRKAGGCEWGNLAVEMGDVGWFD
ncbi:hypothetical protein EV424DRAFT_1360355 [Suillus variegatus]|nr:hypothetical protein EV424DRAFT_1360355 [Suillus variegatus]